MSMSSIAARFGSVAFAAALLFGPGVAYAVSPHFTSATDTVDASGDLLVSFNEAGLGNSLNSVNISADADLTVICNCVNSGGNCPKATNKSTSTTSEEASGTFNVSNGHAQGTLTLNAPASPTCTPTKTACPSSMTLQPTEVSWSNITVTDTTFNDGPFTAKPSSIIATLIPCGK
jgi:hypothetical protein